VTAFARFDQELAQFPQNGIPLDGFVPWQGIGLGCFGRVRARIANVSPKRRIALVVQCNAKTKAREQAKSDQLPASEFVPADD